MAYIVKNTEGINVTQDFRNKEYSGNSIYNVKLTITEKGEGKTPIVVPVNQIAKIVISSPIIDTTSKLLYVGSFISQQITITFRNLDNLPIESGNEVTLAIGTMIDEEMVYVPIGRYLIDDLSENYQTKCEITCLDYGIKFKPAIDISKCFTDGSATINEIFEYICNSFGVTFDEDYPKGNNITTGVYDSTVSGKQWLSWLAELKGCNVKLDRTGVLKLVPLKTTKDVTINALRSKTWELGEKFKISRVRYELEGIESGDTTNNTLYIRPDNLFISGTREDMTTIVNNIYDVVKDTEVYCLKNENFGDITLDSWDIIEFTIGDKTYKTLNNNTITFEQSIMTNIEVKLPTTQQTEVVNVKKEPIDKSVKTIKREIDTIGATITDTIERVDETSNRITTIEESIDGLRLDFQKSGNNLIRNSMFYDFEGWCRFSPYNIAISDTPPTSTSSTYWYCTKTSDLYENGVVYEGNFIDYENSGTITWYKTDIKISNLEASFPHTSNWNIVSNGDTKAKYYSGRALNGFYNYELAQESEVTNGMLFSDTFDIIPTKDKITLSFRTKTSLTKGAGISIGLSLVENLSDPFKDGSQNIYDLGYFVATDDNYDIENELITKTFTIPNSDNAIQVYSGNMAPSDKTQLWLQTSAGETDDDPPTGVLYAYNYENNTWEPTVVEQILKVDEYNLYAPSISYTIVDGEMRAGSWYIWLNSGTFSPTAGMISISMIAQEEGAEVTMELGDIKLEYGSYTEWTPKNTEVMGTTHLLDETGYKIQSGDDTMRIMVDEIAQYYKDTKMFYLNKYAGYIKDFISETTNTDGLMTVGLTVGSNKIYGRYIK